MSEVFISYARETEAHARRVAGALRASGVEVWYDEDLPAHRAFAEVIEERLRSASAVIVIWSARAVKSQWVRAEADTARQAGTLIQVRVDGTTLPLPFNQIQCVDLTGWAGNADAAAWCKVVASVAELAGRAALLRQELPHSRSWRRWLVTRIVALRTNRLTRCSAMLLVATIVVAALATWFIRDRALPSQPMDLAGPSTAHGTTLAVLPFANMSGDPSQQYFSDGMTEEVNSALANVNGLRVIARTSAFQFRDQDRDVRTVAHLMGASHVIEGSIRREGQRVRVSVQLVRGSDGVQLWSQNYDRELKDIFAIQEDIASSIASALRVPLGLENGQQLVADRTTDLDSYEKYLRALALYRGRDIQGAIAVLEPAVARDPAYAPAHSLLAMTYGLVPVYLTDEFRMSSLTEARERIRGAYDKAEEEANEALRLDPRQSEAYDALALVSAYRFDWAASDDNYARALRLNPNDADTLHLYGLTLAATGKLAAALASRHKVQELEPFVPIYNIMTAAIMQLNGDDKDALGLLESTPASGPTSYWRNVFLARSYAASGKYEKAAETLLAISSDVKRVSRSSIGSAAQLLRDLAQGRPLPPKLPVLEGELVFVYAHTAEPERVLDAVEQDLALNFGDLAPFDSPWLPRYTRMRKTERFAALVRNAGLLDYWRSRGWADRCRPKGADGVSCD
jgi:TolB-like protein